MMKNYVFIVSLLIGSLFANALQAQEFFPCKASKKEYKMCKKESKIARKMFRDRPGHAARKHRKARKKYYKMHMKDNSYWW